MAEVARRIPALKARLDPGRRSLDGLARRKPESRRPAWRPTSAKTTCGRSGWPPDSSTTRCVRSMTSGPGCGSYFALVDRPHGQRRAAGPRSADGQRFDRAVEVMYMKMAGNKLGGAAGSAASAVSAAWAVCCWRRRRAGCDGAAIPARCPAASCWRDATSATCSSGRSARSRSRATPRIRPSRSRRISWSGRSTSRRRRWR